MTWLALPPSWEFYMGRPFLAFSTPCFALRAGCPGLLCSIEGDLPDYYDFPPLRWFIERGQPLTKEILMFHTNQLVSEGQLELSREGQDVWWHLMASMNRAWRLLEHLALKESWHMMRSARLLAVLSPDPEDDNDDRGAAPWTGAWYQWQVLLAKN